MKRSYRRLGRAAGCLAILGLIGPALASDRWEEAGSGSVAVLPVPSKANLIVGGSLVCAEQQWTLRLRTESHSEAAAKVPVRLTIDGESYPLAAQQTETAIALPIAYEILNGLKIGNRLAVSAGVDESKFNAIFTLRNSQRVLEAIAPRCSQVDMTAFQKIVISDTDAAVAIAEPLVAEEIKLFRAATTATPKLAATRLDRDGGREMLFATLCGSSWYYGRTGCTLFGYLRTSATEPWRLAYNTEGGAIYVDPNASRDGWPNLVMLDSGGVDPVHWAWNGADYALRDAQVAVDEAPVDTQTP